MPLSGLRLLTVSYRGFDGRTYTGQLVVNRSAAAPLARVFRQLYRIGFPIRHMSVSDAYGPKGGRPADGDVSASFECRQAVPSPCVGGRGTGSWSEHAFGEAVDLNPLENPYRLDGRILPPAGAPYMDRGNVRPGMVVRGSAPVLAFAAVGWGWGGNWSSTPDYQHFSTNGR